MAVGVQTMIEQFVEQVIGDKATWSEQVPTVTVDDLRSAAHEDGQKYQGVAYGVTKVQDALETTILLLSDACEFRYPDGEVRSKDGPNGVDAIRKRLLKALRLVRQGRLDPEPEDADDAAQETDGNA